MEEERLFNPQILVKTDTPLTFLQSFINDQKTRLKLSQDYLFLKVFIGKYFIQSFRVFKLLPEIDSIIFWKRQNNQTHYNFLILSKSLQELASKHDSLLNEEENPVKKMKQLIEKLIRKQLKEYSISVSLIKEMKKLNFSTLENYKSFICSISCHKNLIFSRILSSQSYLVVFQQREVEPSSRYEFQVENFQPKLKKQNQQILHESLKDFQILKDVISLYIDTFANQQKGGYIYKSIDKSSGSFSVDLLLNTVSYIIYEEMNGSCYSQIQPCYWTCFQSSTKRLNSDRKHITLSGCGQICILEIIFMRDMETENKTEYSMMLTDMKKFYRRVKIKTYRIINERWDGSVEKIDLEENNDSKSTVKPIIYKFNCNTACQYPQSRSK